MRERERERTVLVVDLSWFVLWDHQVKQNHFQETNQFLQINNRISAKPPSLNNCLNCMFSVLRHLLSSIECFEEVFFNKHLIDSHNQMLCNCPEESELRLLRSTCYLPERSHLILSRCSRRATGPLNLDCLAVFQTGFLLLGDWGLLVVEGLCISKIVLDHNRDYYYL